VPRRKDPEIAVRNEVIYAKWRSGQSLVSLGQEYQRAPQVIGRIVASFHPEEDEDDDRSLFRGYLWRLFDEVKDLYQNPGFKMAPTGRVAEGPDGEAAEDTNVKLQAAELELKVLESLRKLDARDKQAKKPMETQMAEASMWSAIRAEEQRKATEDAKRAADIRRLEELTRKAGVIPGEVVRELPPS
jgi:hypothetical protein